MKNRHTAILSSFLLSIVISCNNNINNTTKIENNNLKFNSKVLPDPNATPSLYSYDDGVQYAGATYKGNWLTNKIGAQKLFNIDTNSDFPSSNQDFVSVVSHSENSGNGFIIKTKIDDANPNVNDLSGTPTKFFPPIGAPNTNVWFNFDYFSDLISHGYSGQVAGTYKNHKSETKMHSGLPADTIQNKFSLLNTDPNYNNVKYANGRDAWSLVTGTTPYDKNSGEPLVIDCNSNIVTYNGNGWKNKVKNGTTIYKYNYDDKSHSDPSKRTSIEFNFTGTNIELFGIKGLDPGWNNIKITITDSIGNEIPETINQKNIDMGSNIVNENASIIKLNGLKHDTYHVKIESADGSRYPDFRKPTFLYGFTKAVIYPSAELTFNDINVAFSSIKSPNNGKVDLYIDGVKETTLDLSGTNNLSEYVYAKSFTNNLNRRLTIEATPQTSTSGHEFNIDAFAKLPEVEGAFLGDELNLLIYKTEYSSSMDLYVDGVKKLIVENERGSRFDAAYQIVRSYTGFGSGDHKFKLVSRYHTKFNQNEPQQDPYYSMNLDAYSGEYRAGFKFISQELNNSGIEVKFMTGPDYGSVKLSIDNDPAFTRTISLYNTQKTQITESFMNIPIGEHLLIVEPIFSKDNRSSSADVNIDDVKIIGGDSICEPTSLPIPTPS
ncbi:MAG: hypothetical protein U0457_01430 [Candidatus Sericytochromatia bacterium]